MWLERSVFYEIKKTVSTALVVLSIFSIMSTSIASVRVFADDVTITEVSEISTQEQKQIDDVSQCSWTNV